MTPVVTTGDGLARKRHTSATVRGRAGQLFTAYGWDKAKRTKWLDEHAHLAPKELLRAAEAALGVDRRVWRDLPKSPKPPQDKQKA